MGENKTRNTWLVQYHVDRALEAVRDFTQTPRVAVTYPAIARYQDEVRVGDRIIFWVSGPGDKAGVYGIGVVEGKVEDLEHPSSYSDEGGPRTIRPSLPIRYTAMGEGVVVRRTDLRGLAEFAGFELFVMANRPNLFAIRQDQWQVIKALAASKGLNEGVAATHP
jgi:EVE domain